MKTKTFHYEKNKLSITLPGDEGRENVNEFLKLFPGKKTIQTFDDRGGKGIPQIFHFDDEMLYTLEATLSHRNRRGLGIYMTVNETNGQGRKAADVIKVRSVFADLDGSPLAPAAEMSPTVIVESSAGRFHCYWFTSDTPLEAFTPLQENISRILSGDPSVKDLPRVLRVPGFYHMKSEPFMIKITGGSGKYYSYRELVEMFPPLPVQQFSAKRYQLAKQPEKKSFRGNYGAVNGERNKHLIRRAGGMIKAKRSWDYIEAEIYKEALACIPPLPEREVQAVLKSARRYM